MKILFFLLNLILEKNILMKYINNLMIIFIYIIFIPSILKLISNFHMEAYDTNSYIYHSSHFYKLRLLFSLSQAHFHLFLVNILE